MKAHNAAPPTPSARLVAASVVMFMVVAVPALDRVGPRLTVLAAIFASALVLFYLRRASFLLLSRPVIEVLVAFGWLVFAIGWGYVFPSFAPLIIAFAAILVAAAAWLWSIARFTHAPTLQLLGSVVFAEASLLIVPMIRSSGRQAAQEKWLQIRGEVTAQRVRMEDHTGFPEYRVRYEIDGRGYEEYAGSADGLGLTNYGNYKVRRAVEAKMARMPAGAAIEIKVNPAKHSEVYVVERELPARMLAYVTGVIFLLFFLLFAALVFGFL